MVTEEIWKLPAIVDRFLSYRAAIPLAQEQIGVMISILRTRHERVENFLDLGCGDGILGAAILGAYPSTHGVLVDFSEPMLEQARNQLKEYEAQLSFVNLDYGAPAWVNEIDQRRWYRYHQLFAELLRHRLARAYPDQIADLHRRASDLVREKRSTERSGHTRTGNTGLAACR